jgi:hypothetical protein
MAGAWQIKGPTRHQKSTTLPDTGPHGMAQDGRATSENGPPRYARGAVVRIDTEARKLGPHGMRLAEAVGPCGATVLVGRVMQSAGHATGTFQDRYGTVPW